jgi:uncharacterized protein YbjT (DUF2867 family)
MILITTPTGNTGRAALATVAASGADHRVLVRNASKLPPHRAEVITGDMRDPQALKQATNGATAAFFCVPQSPNPENLMVWFNGYAQPFAQAAAEAQVQRIVTISGGDAQSGSRGPGAALQANERIMAQTGAAIRHLRCGYFMENLLWQAQALAHAGIFSLPLAPDVPLAFVAAADIGGHAGRLLLERDWHGVSSQEVFGPGPLSCAAVAEVLSDALGRTVRYVPAESKAWSQQMQGHGLSPAMTQALVEMFEDIAAGRDMGGTPARPLSCTTTLEDWARKVLAPAVRGIRGV